MSNIYHRNRPVTMPHIYFKWGHSRYWDFENVIAAIFFTLVAIAIGTTFVGIGWHIAHRVNAPPPKVITKVVKENGLTNSQNEFIKQCESNTSSDGQDNHGIPNVTVIPYTCTYAK